MASFLIPTTFLVSLAERSFIFLSVIPLILLCKFTTSGDSQGHTQGLVSTFFSLFLGAAAPISKTTRRSLKIIWAISCLFSPSPCWCYFPPIYFFIIYYRHLKTGGNILFFSGFFNSLSKFSSIIEDVLNKGTSFSKY